MGPPGGDRGHSAGSRGGGWDRGGPPRGGPPQDWNQGPRGGGGNY